MTVAIVVVAGVWLAATTGVAALFSAAVPLRHDRLEGRRRRDRHRR